MSKADELRKCIKEMRKAKTSDFHIQGALEEQGWNHKLVDRVITDMQKKEKLYSYGTKAVFLIIILLIGFFVYKRATDYSHEFIPEFGGISGYCVGEKVVDLKYNLNGNSRNLSFVAYKELSNYYKHKSRKVLYFGSPPTSEEIIRRTIDNKWQIEALKPLVSAIQNLPVSESDQARVAVSLAQNIPYDKDATQEGDARYMYEVLYENVGVCSEKAKLMVHLLRELGYGTAILRFSREKHEAVGIACDAKYDYKDSGYCFIEPTRPSIITDSSGTYRGVGQLSSNPEVIVISVGKSLNVSKEYADAEEFSKIVSKGHNLQKNDQDRLKVIADRYGIKV
jgi:hypothetical protein